MTHLVLLRHGQSTWNAENRFTGWTDVDLTIHGVTEAMSAGEMLKDSSACPPITKVHTSLLTRAARTASVCCESLGRTWLPVDRSWRLNERHYGALQGMDKKQATEHFGADLVKIWRRSYDVPPPALDVEDERHPSHDPRYSRVPVNLLPATECLVSVLDRLLPYWADNIVPDLIFGETVLVVAHGNSLRALVKYLDNISDRDILDVEIPTGMPLVYEIDANLRPSKDVPLEERYLVSPDEVRRAQAEVAAQADI